MPLKVIVLPHRKQAEAVGAFKEIKKEVAEIKDFMQRINQHGYFGRKGLAIAQPQVNAEAPKCYFVTSNLKVFINPKITEKENPIESRECCLSYPHRGEKKVRRYSKITVQYQDEKMKPHTETFEGLDAFIFQHEISHLNGKYIYDSK